ncbi:hypothetical protein J2S43_005071 [Catenuloplanes nepalensis]|uniref:DNA-binding protein n=1 Tax=Catenuloplanes nepalensis TaxID=587533 RepID=A0ABT9MYP6_9ACTN|nr:SCO2523 family variant P-loop protein [Catenuloplanes nepalensis]MDP9796559.1 hypothetical protein [Catenuloplanes nepalensis]
MLVFATSDKGGTGRSVTSSNVVYRHSLQGGDACYLDFDFGSPTAGAIFQISAAQAGVEHDGMHSYLRGQAASPRRLNVWTESQRPSLRSRPAGAGRLMLYPGDAGGGEFASTEEIVDRCAELFLRLDEEFDLCLVDLSAGRSYAIDIALAATARDDLAHLRHRWLVFHRWTSQHIGAAASLVYGDRGILRIGEARGHDPRRLSGSVRFVRTAVVDPRSPEYAGLRPEQLAWVDACNQELQRQAARERVGRTLMLGQIPLDPVLQWREQLLTDGDVWQRHAANQETVDALDALAKRIVDDTAWEGL